MEKNLIKQKELIRLLEQQPWEEILVALDWYALRLAMRGYWHTGTPRRGTLVKGLAPQDVAREAICRVLEGRRKWDPEQDPDFLLFMKSVVKSIMWSEWDSAEHKALKGSQSLNADADRSEEQTLVSSGSGHQVPSKEALPSAITEANETYEMVLEAVSGDEQLELLVICIAEGFEKRKDIAKEMGITADEVTNLRKRLKRVLARPILEDVRRKGTK